HHEHPVGRHAPATGARHDADAGGRGVSEGAGGGLIRRRRGSWHRCLAVGAILELLVVGAGIQGCASAESASAQPFSLEPSPGVFASNGRPVRIEEMRAAEQGTRPAVILLHGASGVGSGWLIYPYAEEIARRGIDAFVIHYFE